MYGRMPIAVKTHSFNDREFSGASTPVLYLFVNVQNERVEVESVHFTFRGIYLLFIFIKIMWDFSSGLPIQL